MSAYWQQLTPADLNLVLETRERTAILEDDPDWTVSRGLIRTVVSRVRERIANNRGNILDPDPESIPVTLVDAALDILAVRLLKRFELEVSDTRKGAAAKAEADLDRIAAAQYNVLSPDGHLPVQPSRQPHVTAPDPTYGAGGHGIYPTPSVPRRH